LEIWLCFLPFLIEMAALCWGKMGKDITLSEDGRKATFGQRYPRSQKVRGSEGIGEGASLSWTIDYEKDPVFVLSPLEFGRRRGTFSLLWNSLGKFK